MKKILITGANSYIGTSFEKYMAQFGDEYQIDTVDMIGDAWKEKSFSGYDCVFHVAGIAHQKETLENAHLYYEVNRNLAIATAKKAKREGVKQFILLSSMSVYGMETGVITKETIPHPKSHYGKSKLQADEKIVKLDCDTFKVAILRPPMVYGDGCKGNYQMIRKIVKISPVFPKVNNRRSLISINNQCTFVKKCVENNCSGIFFPQNAEYSNTSELAMQIAEQMGKKIYLSNLLGLSIKIFGGLFSKTRKAFGSLVYSIDKDDEIKFNSTNRAKKKVLFVATVVREHINVFHVPFLKMFKENNWETAVAAKNDYFENPELCHIDYCDQYYDIPFERSPFKKNNIRAFIQLKRIIDKGNYDIIHCHTPVGAMIARLAAVGARRKGTRIIYTAHGFHFYKGSSIKNWLVYFPAEVLLSFFTDTLITINKEDYSRAKKTMHPKEVVFVPGVGIDVHKFKCEYNTRDELIKEFSLQPDTFIVVSVGELIERKNFKTLIKAIKKLENENIVCLICGRGVLETELLKQVESLGIQDKVMFLGFRRDIDRILHGSDVFVFPSYQEGLPVALMEAMAAGLPVIASNIRGNSDLIEDGNNGYLVNSDDYEEISKKILLIKNTDNLQISMRKNVTKDIKKYSCENVNSKMGQVYFK